MVVGARRDAGLSVSLTICCLIYWDLFSPYQSISTVYRECFQKEKKISREKMPFWGQRSEWADLLETIEGVSGTTITTGYNKGLRKRIPNSPHAQSRGSSALEHTISGLHYPECIVRCRQARKR